MALMKELRALGRLRRPLWTGSTRTIGGTRYRVFDDGSLRHATPKTRGKAARRRERRARRLGAGVSRQAA